MIADIEGTDIDEAERQVMEAELDASRDRQQDLKRKVDELSEIIAKSASHRPDRRPVPQRRIIVA